MDSPERTLFAEKTGVSHETLAKFDRYSALLAEWNQKFNLVSENSLAQIWTRHFLDSAQLAPLIPATAKTLADMGSGAGFPGLVLAIMGVAPQVNLIESTGKKAGFLRTVIEDLGLKAAVHQYRVEELSGYKFDVLTARAVGPLPELLKLANHLIHNTSTCLFLKGKSADSELTESKKLWTFDCEKIPSRSDDSGSVLIIKGLKYKNAAPHKRRKRHA